MQMSAQFDVFSIHIISCLVFVEFVTFFEYFQKQPKKLIAISNLVSLFTLDCSIDSIILISTKIHLIVIMIGLTLFSNHHAVSEYFVFSGPVKVSITKNHSTSKVQSSEMNLNLVIEIMAAC